MDFDKLRRAWQESRIPIDPADTRRVADEVARGKARSAQQKLLLYYRYSLIDALLVPCLAPMLVFVVNLPVWMAVLYGAFGILMGVINYLLYRYIAKSDFTSLPVLLAVERALRIKQWQTRIRALGITLAVSLLTTMAVELFDHDHYVMVGFVVGLVAGIAVGLKKYLTMRHATDDLIRQVRAFQSE